MINQEEYEILKGLDDKYKWVARDSGGELWAYKERPFKGTFYWVHIGSYCGKLPSGSKRSFQFIQWEDEEPHEIAGLIREYEIKELRLAPSGTVIVDSFSGSEEIEMKKDIEWLKGRFRGRKIFKPQNDGEVGYNMAIDEFSEYVDQLDEPEVKQIKELESYNDELIRDNNQLRNALDELEVLSQEWIDEHLFSLGDKYPWKEAVPVVDLQNLLVPKQGGPVVPSWFDEWWKDVTKGGGKLFHNIERFYDELFSSGTREMYNYISDPDNKKKLLDIIVNELDYVVEEEQLYYVVKDGVVILSKRYRDYDSHESHWIGTVTNKEYIKENPDKVRFTEQEIKDFDERFWSFAVPVEDEEGER